MRMAVVVPADPDPAVIPVPVPADPEEFRARGHGNSFNDGGGRGLRGYHLDLDTLGRVLRGRYGGIVAVDPDPAPVALHPMAGNPLQVGLRDAVPMPVNPFPVLVAPCPVTADPDVAGSRAHGDPLD